jgi:iron complex transport system substrate-binding protein
MLFAMGLGDQVVGVTHECDWPHEARLRPHLTKSRIHGTGASSAEIDRLVQEEPGSLYDLNAELLARLRPDLILTQSLCSVCAVDEIAVRRVAEAMPGRPHVLSFHPTSLSGVFEMIESIGASANAVAEAARLVSRFNGEIQRITDRMHAREFALPGVVLLEWTDPPFVCGHWTPELIELAGGRELLGRPEQPSRRATWDEIGKADPDLLFIAPCGLTLERALAETVELARRPEWNRLRAVVAGRVFASDGSAYFNRPGPRLIESLQILAEVLHPEQFGGLAPTGSFQQVAGADRNIQ